MFLETITNHNYELQNKLFYFSKVAAPVIPNSNSKYVYYLAGSFIAVVVISIVAASLYYVDRKNKKSIKIDIPILVSHAVTKFFFIN